MVLKSDIEKALNMQRQILNMESKLSMREELQHVNRNESHILVVSGIRRCGKSSLLKLLMRDSNAEYLFLNFEDSRIFQFQLSDFNKLDEIVAPEVQTYFFDEIQNVENWEIYIRQLHDRGKKIFITGSNASLLSKELGTRLTGRYLTKELFPFSYTEFLNLKKLPDELTSFEKYIQLGGFPEFLASNNPEILQNLVKDIVFRDIAIRYGIKNSKTLMDITLFLLSNVGKETTYNRLKNAFEVGSANSVSDYLKWLEDCYLLFFLKKFSWSAKSIAVNPRKVYGIDTGLIQANSLSFTSDKGRLFENAVFLFLRRKRFDLYYFKENSECDFVVFNQGVCTMLVQVCEEIHSDNQHREVKGLVEAMHFFQLEIGYIVTKNQSDSLEIDGKKVVLIPVIDWMKLNF